MGRHCVCYLHHHHVYWRFDFDIVTSWGNSVKELNYYYDDDDYKDDKGDYKDDKGDYKDDKGDYKDDKDDDDKDHHNHNRRRSHEKTYEKETGQIKKQGRRWEISDAEGHAYSLTPGRHDGKSTPYGVGDLWVLRYHGDELDDSVHYLKTGNTKAQLDEFVNDETVNNDDVVIWYGAHFKHDESGDDDDDDDDDNMRHIVGPVLRPVNWRRRE